MIDFDAIRTMTDAALTEGIEIATEAHLPNLLDALLAEADRRLVENPPYDDEDAMHRMESMACPY